MEDRLRSVLPLDQASDNVKNQAEALQASVRHALRWDDGHKIESQRCQKHMTWAHKKQGTSYFKHEIHVNFGQSPLFEGFEK